MSTTIQQLAAKLGREVTAALIRNVEAMDESKVAWQPEGSGRTVLSIIQECAIITGFSAHTLTHLAMPEGFHGEYGRLLGEYDTLEKAVAALKANSELLANAQLSFDAENLEKTIVMPWAANPLTFAELMFGNYWNSVYHIGQICYIQTLYGDKEMH